MSDAITEHLVTAAAAECRRRSIEFIPVRKSDIVEALVEQGAFATTPNARSFAFLRQTLASIFHYRVFREAGAAAPRLLLFQPRDRAAPDDGPRRDRGELRGPAAIARKGAQGREFRRAAARRHRRRAPAAHVLRVEVRAPLDDFRDVRFYRRGRHLEQFEVREWFGLRRRKVEVEVYDDVVLWWR